MYAVWDEKDQAFKTYDSVNLGLFKNIHYVSEKDFDLIIQDRINVEEALGSAPSGDFVIVDMGVPGKLPDLFKNGVVTDFGKEIKNLSRVRTPRGVFKVVAHLGEYYGT